jgi:hypothetical protein
VSSPIVQLIQIVNMIDEVLGNIQGFFQYKLSAEQLEFLKKEISGYACACCMDSDIREEAFSIDFSEDS